MSDLDNEISNEKESAPIATKSEPAMTPVQKLGEAIADRIERWMPNPFLFAILLTYLDAMAALSRRVRGPLKSPNHGMAVFGTCYSFRCKWS